MPALTHNRVKNGFNGGIRKKNASTGTVKSRTMGMGKVDGLRRKALVGGIGSMPTHIRQAYNRRVRCSCSIEPLTLPSFTSEPTSYAQAGSTYSFTLTYAHEVNNRLTTFEVLSKPSWLTLDSFDFQNQIGVFSGIPQTSDVATNFTLSIKLIDEKQKEVIKNFTIKVYLKVYDVTVSNEGVSPNLNYYKLSDYDGNQINLGETMIYQTGATALYRFNQHHISNTNHPIRFTDQNGNTNRLSSDMTIVGVPGNQGSYVEFLSNNTNNYIYCLYHGFGMGGFYQPTVSTLTMTIASNKYVINNNTGFNLNLNYRGAYLFNLTDTTNNNYDLVFKTTDDVNGTDYTNYYTYGVPGTSTGYVVLVVNDNLNVTMQEASNANFGSHYNSSLISISSTNQVGSIAMSGTFKQDQIITAVITDNDGVPADSSITYQWYRDDVAIVGANSKTYTIVADDYNKEINVNAKYIDNAGFNEDVTSTKSIVQDTPGTITLVGNYRVNNAITAQLVDIDGNGVNTITSYQWVKHSNAGNVSSAVNITGATAFSYTPVIADIGSFINVKISYQDNNGTSYTNVMSVNSVEVLKEVNSPGNLEITGLLQSTNELTATVTDNNSINSGSNVTFTWIRVASGGAETQIGTPNVVTATSTTTTITNTYTLTNDDIDNQIKVRAVYQDRGGNDESLLTITSTIQRNDSTAPVIAAVTQVPTPNIDTTPSFVFSSDEIGTISSNYTFTSPSPAESVVGNNTITFDTLTVGTYNDVWVKVTDAAGNESNELTLDSFVIEAASSNGSVAVSGTEQVGYDLAATVTDSNVANFGSVTVTYQWIRNSSGTLTNIGTNSNTYTLVAADVGNTIRVNVTYTDDLGNAEDITSSDTGSILAAGPVITETAAILPSIEPTPTYEFNSDKTGTITSNYQFLSSNTAVVGTNKIRFSSLKEGTYNDIWVKVTDGNGSVSNQLMVNTFTVETPDFVNDAGMSNTNDGIAYISGNCMEGEQLTCVIVDTAATGASFVWKRITGERPNITEAIIAGATAQTYTLTNDDVGKRIQVELSYTDNETPPNSESMKTWYSSVVSDKSTLTFSASGLAYRIDTHGTDNHPTLTLERGLTYTFNLNVAGHPFRIQTNNVAASDPTAELYNSGLSHSDGTTGSSAQDKTSGTLTFVVPNDAPDTLYYRCQAHLGMVGAINIVSNKLRIYYDDVNIPGGTSLKAIIDKSTVIVEDLFDKFKQDYNVIVRVKPASDFSSPTTIASASYQSQTIDINVDRLDTITQGTLNDQPVDTFVTTFVHELFHVFELVANTSTHKTAFLNLTDPNHYVYTGAQGLAGYKQLITTNNNANVFTGSLAKTLDIPNMTGVPVEDDFGEGTQYYHWEEGLHDNGDGTTSAEPRTFSSVDYPILTNEIMTGLKAGHDKYLTPMTTGALKDVGHSINDASIWVAETGANMNWV